MRSMSLDLGSRTIGVAVSDLTGLIDLLLGGNE